MFVRFGMNQSSWTTGQLFGLLGGPTLSSANTAAGVGGAHVYSGTISGTYVFTAHVVGDAHFGYTRINSFSQQPNQDQNLGATLLQVPGLSTALETPYQQKNEGGMPTLNIDNFGVLGSPNNFQPQSYNDPNRNFDGNVSWIKGTHEIRGGFEADYIATNEMQYQQTGAPFDSGAGGFHFATGTTALNGGPAGNDFNSFAAFLLGLPQDSGKVYQFPPYMYTRTKTYGIYLPFDIKHNFQTTLLVELPFGKNKSWLKSGVGAAILGDWRMSGVVSAYSGRPFTATAANSSLNAQFSSQFADCIPRRTKLATSLAGTTNPLSPCREWTFRDVWHRHTEKAWRDQFRCVIGTQLQHHGRIQLEIPR